MKPQKPYARSERVRAQIMHVLAEEVERRRDELGFVTVTDVTLTPDLRRARAYYTILDEGEEHDRVRAAVEGATKRLRAAIAKGVRLKFAPDLEMIEDPVPERAARVDELIRKLHEGDG